MLGGRDNPRDSQLNLASSTIVKHPWPAALGAGLFAFAANAWLAGSLLIPLVVGVVWFVITGVTLTRWRDRGEVPPPLDRLRLWWIAAVGLVLAVALALALPSIIRDNYGDELRSYYRSLKDGDIAKAYESLCPTSKAQISSGEFSDRLQRQLNELGAIKSYRSLRGDKTVGYTVVEGSRKTVLSLVPVERVDGRWMPCPSDQPLGELRSPP